MIQQQGSSLSTEQLYQATQGLSFSEKADLINKMLKGSGLNVTFDRLNTQVHKMSSAELADLIKAIAQRVEQE